MALSAFRRSAATETKQRGGKGFKGNFYDKLNVPKDSPTPILMLRGEYKDPNPSQDLIELDPVTGQPKDVINYFYKLKKHKRKIQMGAKEEYRDEPCSAGTDLHNPQPCAGCQAMDQGDKSVTLTDAYLFPIIHMHPYHTHPLIDKQSKQIVMKKDGSGAVTISTACEGRLCNFCRVARGEQPVVQQGGEPWPGWQANQFTTQFGYRRYLEVGKSHLSDLDGFESIISSKCQNPQCGNQLVTDGYACPHCRNMVIDMLNDTRSDKEIAEAVIKPYPCLHCRRSVFLTEVVSCEACEGAGRQFVQLSLFDCVVNLFKQGENTKSHLQMQNATPIDAFGQQLTNSGWLQGGKTVRQLIEEIGKPYDFAEMFKPRSMEDQIKRLMLRPQQQQSAYGQQPQQPMYGQQPQQPGFMPPQGGMPPQMVGYAPQQQPMYPAAPPMQPGFAPYQPQQVMPQGTAMPVQQGYQPQPQQGQGPAPFVPNGRSNFGS